MNRLWQTTIFDFSNKNLKTSTIELRFTCELFSPYDDMLKEPHKEEDISVVSWTQLMNISLASQNCHNDKKTHTTSDREHIFPYDKVNHTDNYHNPISPYRFLHTEDILCNIFSCINVFHMIVCLCTFSHKWKIENTEFPSFSHHNCRISSRKK